MGADTAKKQKSGVEEENNGALIDGELVLSVGKLQEVQDELENINKEASEKVLEVVRKYNEIHKLTYDKRNEIIKSIPNFWMTTFISHPALSVLLTEEDQKIFMFLNNLQVEDTKDVKSGYSITFEFNPNPYFEDTHLSKTFAFLEEGDTKITATSIKWKEGMGIPNGVAEDKKGKKCSHSEESFFTWFSESEHKNNIYVADIIKEDMWPNPIRYLNNNSNYKDEVEVEDDEDEEYGDSSGDDGDDTEEDDEEDEN